MSKSEAERLIRTHIEEMANNREKDEALNKFGVGISSHRWRAANIHRKLYGPGIPNFEPIAIKHRRRIEEKTVQDFVEWLNAGDYLQNLAFGEKTVKISNGFHVAIEYIKRKNSIIKITRDYYRNFLDGCVDEDVDNDNSERNAVSDVDEYSDDDNDDIEGECLCIC